MMAGAHLTSGMWHDCGGIFPARESKFTTSTTIGDALGMLLVVSLTLVLAGILILTKKVSAHVAKNIPAIIKV